MLMDKPSFEMIEPDTPTRIRKLIWFIKRAGLPYHHRLKFKDGHEMSVVVTEFGYCGGKYAWDGGWSFSHAVRFSPMFRSWIICHIWGLIQFKLLWRPDKLLIDYSHKEATFKIRLKYGIIAETVRFIKWKIGIPVLFSM